MIEMVQMLERLLARMEAKMDSNQKKAEADRDELKAKLDSNRSRMAKFEEKMDDYRKRRMAHHTCIMACLVQTEANTEKTVPDSEMMQSVKEHQEVPREEVAVTPVKGLKKRRRVQKLAAERLQELKERTQGFCGSRKRVTVACRMTFRHSRLARRKKDVFKKKIRIQGSRELRKKLAADGITMTHSAKVARRRGHARRLYDQGNVGQRTQKRWTSRMRLWKRQESEIDIRGRD
jgi:hypothetical protein